MKTELAKAEAELAAVATAAAATAEPGLKRGDLVEATILETSPTAIKVQLGEHGEGTIPSGELERMGRTALEALEMGTPVTVYIVNPRAGRRPVVSMKRAEEEHNWQSGEHHESQEVYFSKVAGYNKGGLIVTLARCAGSCRKPGERRAPRGLAESPEARWGNMVGETIVVKVIEIDRAVTA